MLLIMLMDIFPDKYPLSVQNIKYGSRLYVNTDIAEIQQFRNRFVINFAFFICKLAATLTFLLAVHSVCVCHFTQVE